MKENWINENLCSFDEKVRIELGPQIIELDCTHANLSDYVTAPHYQAGKIDAYGKTIVPKDGGKMHCVDWREKHVPKVWKVYQWQDTGEVVKDDKVDGMSPGDPIFCFVKVGEYLEKADALKQAKTLAGEK